VAEAKGLNWAVEPRKERERYIYEILYWHSCQENEENNQQTHHSTELVTKSRYKLGVSGI
jgi:hypothetical protein